MIFEETLRFEVVSDLRVTVEVFLFIQDVNKHNRLGHKPSLLTQEV